MLGFSKLGPGVPPPPARRGAGVSQSLLFGLFGALPRGFSDCSHRCGRVGVFQLVGGKCRDYSLLVATYKIRENTALNVRDDRLVGFIDSVRTKTGDEPR